MEKKILYFQTEIKGVTQTQKGTLIKGYASTNTKDRYDDIVEPEAFRKSIATSYRKNPIILFQHKNDFPIGKAVDMRIDDQGLDVEGLIVDRDIEPKIQAGILGTFSIGYIPKSVEYRDKNGYVLDPKTDSERIWFEEGITRHIKELDLVEISVVSVPANPDALFTLQKSLGSFFEQEKAEFLKTNPEIMKKDGKNLLDKKEVEEENNENNETEAAESSDEGAGAEDENTETPEGDETDTEEEADEKDGEGEESEDEGEAEEEKSEDDDDSKEESEEDESEEDEKSVDKLDKTLVTEENMKELAIKTGEALNRAEKAEKRVAELEGMLKQIPQKQALMFGIDADQKTPEKGAKGFKQSLLKNAV